MTPDEQAAADRLREILTSTDDVRFVLVRTFTHGEGVVIEHRPIEAKPRWRQAMVEKGRKLPLLLPADGETVADVLRDLGAMRSGTADALAAKIDAIDADADPEKAHGDLDALLVAALPAEARAAVARLHARAPWWAGA